MGGDRTKMLPTVGLQRGASGANKAPYYGTSRARSNGSGGGAGLQEAILSARHDALRRITGGPAYARG